MKLSAISIILASFATSCTTVPNVDVKKRGSQALISYSFVPLYPARGGVEIGDIRIHRIKKPGATLDSRLFYSNDTAELFEDDLVEHDAILPGIETFQLTKLNGEKLLGAGLLRKLLGRQFESQASLNLALGGLKTSEIADVKIAKKYLGYLDKLKNDDEFKLGLCASAITLGNGELDDIGISVITRLIKASSVEYFSNKGFSTMESGSGKPAEDDAKPTPASTNDAIEVTRRAALTLNKLSLDKPITIGVDALSITPKKLYETRPGTRPTVKFRKLCKGFTHNRFVPAQLDALRKRLGVKAQ